jgi:hypothetical protein
MATKFMRVIVNLARLHRAFAAGYEAREAVLGEAV